jgi:hypothetical protein
MQPVGEPKNVCEQCIVEGTHWVHLRQCLTCGRTLCCDDSPRRHMSGHWREVGHPIMRTLPLGADSWTWCFADDAPIREVAGAWQVFDPYVETGTRLAGPWLEGGGSLTPPIDMEREGFPLGDWFAYVRERHESGSLHEDDAAAIAALPGWRWESDG